MATVLDTHKAIRDLEAAGIEPRHAEAVVELWRQGREADLAALATKGDLATLAAEQHRAIADLTAELRREMAELRSEMTQVEALLERRIDQVEHRLITRLGAMMAAAVAILGTLVALL